MSTHSPITRLSFGRTFTVAGVTLGAIALLQVGAVTWRFLQQPVTAASPEDAPPEKIDIRKIAGDAAPPAGEEIIAPNEPLENEPVIVNEQGARPVPVRPDPAIVATPVKPAPPVEPEPTPPPVVAISAGGPVRPTPVPLAAFTHKVDSKYTELIEEGKLLRNSGDTAGARIKFGQAANLDPANAQAIAELAYTFEKMTLPDRAAEQWHRVLALGENAGAYYSAAKAKLDIAIGTTVRPGGPSATASATSANIAEGRSLGLGQPVMQPEASTVAAKKFTLQIPIVARRGVPVSKGDVKILVLFYEQLNGKDLTNSTANVKYTWASPPADWAEESEILEVNHELPMAAGERRSYYGYIARLYYKGELQATHAEPASLNQKFPAPPTLSE